MPTSDDRGIPSTESLRRAATALGIPIDDARRGLAELSPERQATALLAVVSSWLNAVQYVHASTADRIELAELAVLVRAAEDEATGGTPSRVLDSMLWRVQWAALTVTGFDRRPEEISLAGVCLDLLQAAAGVIATWSEAESRPGIQLDDDSSFSAVDSTLIADAAQRATAAARALNELLGPTEA